MSQLILEEQTSPSAPSVNKIAIYPKAGGDLYITDDEGTEKELVTDSSALLRSEWNQNGFVNTTDSTMSFVDGTRTFTIAPAVTNFDYFVLGTKYTKSASEDIVISDIEGIHVIYYDGNSLTEAVNPNDGAVDTIFRTKAIITTLYWDVSATKVIYFGEERHGISMSSNTHAYLHFTAGLAYLGGLGLNTMSVDGTGITADAQFGIDAGNTSDEDLHHSVSAVLAVTGLPIYYMLGAGADWQKHIEAGFSVRTFDGTDATRIAYNQFTGGAWQLTEVTNNDFVLCHIFVTTEKDHPLIAVMGQEIYTTKTRARNGAKIELLSLIINDILFPEIHPIATVIFQTNTSYANAVNGKIVSTDDGDAFIDWRSETISRVAISTDNHGSLVGLSADDHPQYIKDSEFTQNSGILVGTGAGTFQEEVGATLQASFGIYSGTGTFAGTAGDIINIGATLAGTTYHVFVTPKGYAEDVGAYYVDEATKTTTTFSVKCSGSGTPDFSWLLIDRN